MSIRVRFAPSPTGPLSFGNVRTALFNWLFARRYGGEFVLRIEDTDKERSKKEFEDDLLTGLKWLGLNWDGAIERQSQRTEIYKKYLKKLLEEKKAYYCFCSEEKLDAERQEQLTRGIAPKYAGTCENLSEIIIQEKILKGEPSVIRFRMPAEIVVFNDLIRGKTSFDTGLFGDIVIAKGLEQALYNFAVVIDDFEMKISHVIRGEDHISNTPKQIMIQRAFGFTQPEYGHLPLILGPDRKKLSKRYLETSFNQYAAEGFLPEAMMNFLVLLGWHPAQDREVVTKEEMLKEFELDRVQKGGAIFNLQKLDWFNSHYLRQLDNAELLERLKSFVPATWLKENSRLIRLIKIEKSRLKNLKEFGEENTFLFEMPDYSFELLSWKETPVNKTEANLEAALILIESWPDENFTDTEFQNKLNDIALKNGRGETFWPLRAALSGQKNSPGPTEIMEILGKTESVVRIKNALKKLGNEKRQ
ncbi:MAG: glutamate--tRNA ligase [bacterium]|nr:glutamate--tRNA ligase [bacterium]